MWLKNLIKGCESPTNESQKKIEKNSSPIKMMNIHMNKDTEESCENLFTECRKRLGKRYIGGCWKDVVIIYLTFRPIHEILNILRCWQCSWFLVFVTVLPKVFIPTRWWKLMKSCSKLKTLPWSTAHFWTRRFSAVLSDSSIN